MVLLSYRRPILIGFLALFPASCAAPPSPPRVIIESQDGPNPWTDLQFFNDPDNFQFVIVSDRTGGHREGVFPDGLTKANLLRPEFVMSVGDLIEGYTEDEAQIDRQWDEFQAFLERLAMPFFYLPGNHDITNPVMARKWAQRLGRAYYHFVYRDTLFLCLNTEDGKPSHIGADQRAYFRQVLDAHPDVRWTLVFLHKPLWTYKRKDNGWAEVEALLQGRSHTVFAGHYHTYTRYERNDRNYIVLATTGGVSQLRGPNFGEFDHVMWVTMTDGGPVLANLLLSGIWDENVVNVRTWDLMKHLGAVGMPTLFVEGDTFTGGKITLRLPNGADVPITVEAAFAPHAFVKPSPARFEMQLEPNTVKLVDVQLNVAEPVAVDAMGPLQLHYVRRAEAPDHRPLELELTPRIGICRQYECPRRTQALTIDAALADWQQFPYAIADPHRVVSNGGTWHGPNDASARFAVQYDEQFLYVAVAVTDERALSRPDARPWEQDGVEIRVDGRPDPHRSAHFGRSDFDKSMLYAVSPGATGDDPVVHRPDRLPDGSRYACQRTATGFAAEIAMPMAYLRDRQGEDPRAFRLNIAIEDFDDPDEGGTELWWQPDWRSSDTFTGSGTFYLAR